jgi:ATP-dependent exoDNAse (exonuclease V) beta subunit
MLEPITSAANPGTRSKALDPVDVEFDWAGEAARHIGTVVHTMLQRIAEEGVGAWPKERVLSARGLYEFELRRLGVAPTALPNAVVRVVDGLCNATEDARGRWLLQPHREARSEWRLTGVVEGGLVNVAIDRTFVDEDGTRWIVDFKTGSHDGGDPDAFLDNEQRRYRRQLETYRQLLAAKYPGDEIRLALYFPMLRGWREWR